MANRSSHRDDIPSSAAPYRELTVAGIALGVAQGIVLNVAFVYAALKLGFSIGGSTVAAIMGYALLRGVLKKGTLVENNINQTIASGINTAGTGVVFTVPALFMLDAKWRAEGLAGLDLQPIPLIIAGIAGAVLGVVVIIPLRKQMIELDRLRFPSGVATATIIRAGSSGAEKARLLAAGVLVSGLWKLVMLSGWLEGEAALVAARGWGVSHEEFHFSFGVLPDYISPVLYLSLMNIAAGLLAGRGGLPFFAGGLVAWWAISPAAVSFDWVTGPVTEQSSQIYGSMLRPLGIGVLIGGGVDGRGHRVPGNPKRAEISRFGGAHRRCRFAGRRRRNEIANADLRYRRSSGTLFLRLSAEWHFHRRRRAVGSCGNTLARIGRANCRPGHRYDRHLTDVRHGLDFRDLDDVLAG